MIPVRVGRIEINILIKKSMAVNNMKISRKISHGPGFQIVSGNLKQLLVSLRTR